MLQVMPGLPGHKESKDNRKHERAAKTKCLSLPKISLRGKLLQAPVAHLWLTVPSMLRTAQLLEKVVRMKDERLEYAQVALFTLRRAESFQVSFWAVSTSAAVQHAHHAEAALILGLAGHMLRDMKRRGLEMTLAMAASHCADCAGAPVDEGAHENLLKPHHLSFLWLYIVGFTFIVT